jgi:RND family efflux transporter MFP subunit
MPESETEERRRSRIWLLVIALLLCGAAGFAAWRIVRTPRSAAGADARGRWVSPQIRPFKTRVNATGIVRLRTGAEVRVGAQVSGIVKKLFVTVGTRVQQGQVIAEIDSLPIEARVQQARAQLQQALVTQAKAKVDESRSQQLYEAGIIPRQQFDDDQANLAAANASVETAQSGVAEASVELGYVQIRAPIQGTIATISTQQGETVAASFTTPTFVTIIKKDALEVVAMVDEADIGNVRPGEKATFTTETWSDREFAGTVERIAPAATIISGVVNYEVAIAIERDVGLLKPDMTSNVNIVTSERRALIIPATCVQRDSEGAYVTVRNSSGASMRRRVVVGSKSDGDAEIVSGLNADTSVLEPQERRQ